MTSLLPIAGGLRLAKNVRIHPDLVNDYILPATADDADLTQSTAAQAALEKELAISLNTHPEPGVVVDSPDPPQR